MATLKNIGNELKERLLDRDVEVGKIDIEDEDVSYPIIRLYYTDGLDEDLLDDYVEVIRNEINEIDLSSVYDDNEDRYVKYEVSLIEPDYPSFNIYLQEI